MTTRVVNRRVEDFDVAIDRSSIWGNPYGFPGTRAKFFVASRDEAVRKYREWVLQQPQLLARLDELKEKRLGCWCKPLSCHGDVLVELLLEKEAGLR